MSNQTFIKNADISKKAKNMLALLMRHKIVTNKKLTNVARPKLNL